MEEDVAAAAISDFEVTHAPQVSTAGEVNDTMVRKELSRYGYACWVLPGDGKSFEQEREKWADREYRLLALSGCGARVHAT